MNKYLENYERALSGFEAAALKDPGLNATKEVEKLVNLLDNLDYLLKVGVFALTKKAECFQSAFLTGLLPILLLQIKP